MSETVINFSFVSTSLLVFYRERFPILIPESYITNLKNIILLSKIFLLFVISKPQPPPTYFLKNQQSHISLTPPVQNDGHSIVDTNGVPLSGITPILRVLSLVSSPAERFKINQKGRGMKTSGFLTPQRGVKKKKEDLHSYS